jgi:hypothetical protein
MTKTLNKNILEVTVGLICHQTNCFGAFGGLAGAIGAKWPIVKKEYSDTILQNNERWKLLGEYQTVEVGHNLRVLNIFSQYDYGLDGRKTEYSAVKTAFKKIANNNFMGDDRELADTFMGPEEFPNQLTDVYIPFQYGSGLGGGNWAIILEIIEEAFDKSDKNVYICKL